MVKQSRRAFLQAVSAAGGFAIAPSQAMAEQAYPAKPLRWIVGFPPGGGADIVSRIVAPWLAERLGQPVIIENKPGASTNVSIQAGATSPPDGYTLCSSPPPPRSTPPCSTSSRSACATSRRFPGSLIFLW
jgi:tripartite-type tricarboxylate transporter receptor subunit TctC